jgi:hypothetical protein
MELPDGNFPPSGNSSSLLNANNMALIAIDKAISARYEIAGREISTEWQFRFLGKCQRYGSNRYSNGTFDEIRNCRTVGLPSGNFRFEQNVP